MNDQQHIDPATLDMLEEVLEDGFIGLLETFIDDSRVKIVSLKSGLADANADVVRRSAHSLKGSSSNLGANPMAELCQRVEQQAREENLEGLDDIVEQIEAEYQHVETIMKEKMEKS
ncbi:MAG: Hpt domain-containing protein [Cellvibrionaceae bacterium]